MLQKINKACWIVFGLSGHLALTGCQTPPKKISVPNKATVSTTPAPAEKPKVYEKDGIKIIPYDRPEIKRENLQIIIPDQKPKATALGNDGRQIPAFQALIQQTQTAFQRGQFDEAEKTALQAQRLAPQAAETYMYLAIIANQRKQPKNAESLARRGLTYARSTSMQRQLWLIIQKSAQLQQNTTLQKEAQLRLQSLS